MPLNLNFLSPVASWPPKASFNVPVSPTYFEFPLTKQPSENEEDNLTLKGRELEQEGKLTCHILSGSTPHTGGDAGSWRKAHLSSAMSQSILGGAGQWSYFPRANQGLSALLGPPSVIHPDQGLVSSLTPGVPQGREIPLMLLLQMPCQLDSACPHPWVHLSSWASHVILWVYLDEASGLKI